MGGGGHRDQEVVDVGYHKAPRYRHVEGGYVEKKKEEGDGGPLGGGDGNWGGKVGGALEHQGTGSF